MHALKLILHIGADQSRVRRYPTDFIFSISRNTIFAEGCCDIEKYSFKGKMRLDSTTFAKDAATPITSN